MDNSRSEPRSRDPDEGLSDAVRNCLNALEPLHGWIQLRERLVNTPLLALQRQNARLRRWSMATGAACLAVGLVAGWQLALRASGRAGAAFVESSWESKLTADSAVPLEASIDVFTKLTSFYEGRANWVAHVDDRIDLGLIEDGAWIGRVNRGAWATELRLVGADGDVRSTLMLTGLPPCAFTSTSTLLGGERMTCALQVREQNGASVRAEVQLTMHPAEAPEGAAPSVLSGAMRLRSGQRLVLGDIRVNGEIRRVEVRGLWKDAETTGPRS